MLRTYDEIDFVLKVVICGEESSGKTSLVRRFTEESFSIQEAPTLGVGLYIRCLNAKESGRIFKLQIWDTSGKQRFESARIGWFQSASIYIFVYDTCSRNSFNRVSYWLEQAKWIKNNDETAWHSQENSNAIGILVGTQMDRVTFREVDNEEAREWAIAHSLQFLETSALTGDQVQATFQNAVDIMDAACRQMTQQELLPLLNPELTMDDEVSHNITLIANKTKKCCCCNFW